MLDVITMGETMLLLTPGQAGPLRYVNSFNKTLGGAESAFAIALTRLGHRAGWISRLGQDEFGKYIYNFIRGEGVDVASVVFDTDHPTGLFFKERREGDESRVFYYRQGSAASCLSPTDIRKDYLQRARWLHITGITPALSSSCQAAVERAAALARECGLSISFDPNLRLKLWDIATARSILTMLAANCDIFFPGEKELALLYPGQQPEQIAERLFDQGLKKMVVKLGSQGCRIYSPAGATNVAGFEVREVDPIGAGDGFAAGFLAGQLRQWDDFHSAQLANAVGAMAVTVTGDIEGYPTLDEAQQFIAGQSVVER